MKVVINESRLDQIMRSYIRKKLGEFVPASGKGHPDYVGGFFSDPEDETPIAYVKDYKYSVLYVDISFIKTLVSLFSIPHTSDNKPPPSKTMIEVAQELINNDDIVIYDINIF
jgi:hypothetical protein